MQQTMNIHKRILVCARAELGLGGDLEEAAVLGGGKKLLFW